MAASKTIRQFKYDNTSTTMSKTFTNAATWTADATLKITEFDDSGLEYAAEPDAALLATIFGQNPPIPTLRRGGFSFGMYLDTAFSNTDDNPQATLLVPFLGQRIQPQTARTDALDSSGVHTATTIYASGLENNTTTGTCFLVGALGDGRGNGECKPVAGTGTDLATLKVACSNAPADGDNIVLSTTVFINPAQATQYLDFWTVGGDSEEERQMIGCIGGVSLDQANPGELPMVKFNIDHVADWQWVAAGDRAGIDFTIASEGDGPPVDRGIGGFFFGDQANTIRTVFKGGNLSINRLTHDFAELPDANGVNSVGGYVRVPPSDPITVEFDLIFDEDNIGLYNDFANEASTGATLKRLLMQFGHTQGRCVAIEIPRLYIAQAPTTSEINGLASVHLVCHAVQGTQGNVALDSPILIHYF